MPKEKRKRDLFDVFSFDEEGFLAEPKLRSGGSSSYSISVTYDEKGRPVVKVQTRGDIDVAELRRDIEQRYPGAKIEGLETQPLIRVVGEEKEEQKKEQKETKKDKKEKKEDKEPLIRIVE